MHYTIFVYAKIHATRILIITILVYCILEDNGRDKLNDMAKV